MLKKITFTTAALLLTFAVSGCEDKGAAGAASAKASGSAKPKTTAAKTATAGKTAEPKAGGVDCEKFLAQYVKASGRPAPSDEDKKDFLGQCETYGKQKPEAFKKCADCIMAAEKKEDLGTCQKPKAACDGFDL